jgi:hypothetical protein
VPAVCKNYAKEELVEKLELPREVLTYGTAGIRLSVNEEAYKNFMPKRIEPTGIDKLGVK